VRSATLDGESGQPDDVGRSREEVEAATARWLGVGVKRGASFAITFVGATLVASVLVGCGCEPLSGTPQMTDLPQTTTSSQTTATSGGATSTTESRAPTTETTLPAPPAEGILPSLVGLDLQLAQDTLQAGGWYVMTSYDTTGQGRMQLVDRNWVVVEQIPAAGESVPYSKTIQLGVVKKGEPGSEVLKEADGVPAVVGKNLQLAIDTLQSAGYYLFEYVDATGGRLTPIVHSNWVVTGQDPAAGTDLATDRVVTLEIEKVTD